MEKVFYDIHIVSLNADWIGLSMLQLKKLPTISQFFGIGGCRDISNLEESTKDDVLIKNYILTMNNLCFEDVLKPGDIKYVEDISWIFELDERKWNEQQRRVYGELNPEYEIDGILHIPSLYKCVNCNIQVNKIDDARGRCVFHSGRIDNFENMFVCKCCGIQNYR